MRNFIPFLLLLLVCNWQQTFAQCSAPGAVTLTTPASSSSFILQWAPVSGATQYQVRYWETIAPGDKTIISDPVTAPYVLGGLRKNTTYSVQIRSVCGNSFSAWGPSVNFLTAKSTELCSLPSGMTVNVGAGSLQVNWTSMGDHSIRYRAGYTGDWTVPAGALVVSNQNFLISGLSPGTYQVELMRLCWTNSSYYIRQVKTVTVGCDTPAAPSVIPDATSASVMLPAIVGVTGYNVRYRQGASGTWISAGVNIPSSLCYITPLSPATEYHVQIQAVCGDGGSAYSAHTSFTTLVAGPCLGNRNFGKNLDAVTKSQIDSYYNSPSPYTLGSMVGVNDGGLIFRSFQGAVFNQISQLTVQLRNFHTMDEDFDPTLTNYAQNIKPKDTSPEGTPGNTARNQGFYNLYHNNLGFTNITSALELLDYAPQTWKEKIYRESDWSVTGAAGIRNSFENYTKKFIDVFAPANGMESQLLVSNYQVGNELWDYPVKADYHSMLIGAHNAFVAKYGDKSAGGWRMKLVAGAFQAYRDGNCIESLRDFSNCGASLDRHDFIGDYLGLTDCAVLKDLDAVDCHPYSFLPKTTTWTYPENPLSEDQQIRNLAGWLHANQNTTTGVLAHTRLWASEYGFDSNPTTGVGEKTQSAYLIRGLLLHSRYHFEKVFFYNAFDHSRETDQYYTGLYGSSGFWKLGTHPANSAWPSPLIEHGATAKPSWYGMKDLKSRFGNHVFYKALVEDNDAYVWLLAKPDGTDPYLVFWSPQQTNDANINQEIAINKVVDWTGILPGTYSLDNAPASTFAESTLPGQSFTAATGTECNTTTITKIRRNPSFVRLTPCTNCLSPLDAGSTVAPVPASGVSPFDPATISSAAPASGAGAGTLLYQWQQSTDGVTFTDIPGAIGLTFDPPALSQTTYFRRGAKRRNCPDFVYTPALMLQVLSPGCPAVASFKRLPHESSSCNPSGDYYYEIMLQNINMDDTIELDHMPGNGLFATMSSLNDVMFTLPTFHDALVYQSSSNLQWLVKAGQGATQTLKLYYCWSLEYPEPAGQTMATSKCSGMMTGCSEGNNGQNPDTDERRMPFKESGSNSAFALKLQPNPGSDHVLLTYTGEAATQANLRVVSATGQLMLSNVLETLENAQQWPIDANDWPAGVYFLQLQANGEARYQLWEKQ